MPDLLKLIHAFLGLNAIAAGIPAAIKIVSGRPFEQWATHFLRFSLSASAVGLVLSINHLGFVQGVTMLGVYMSAIAVLAGRRSKSSDGCVVFMLSTMSVICLNLVVVLAHIFRLLAAYNVLESPEPALLFPISTGIVILLFAVLCLCAAKKLHHGTIARHPQGN